MSFRVSVSKKDVWFLALLVVIASALSLRPALAQTVYGSVYGTAIDASGSVVPNATVTVTNEQKGISLKTQTNAAGEYRIDHLVPNPYTISVTAAGFKTFTLTGVQINAGDAPRVDATLTIGSTSESVTVSSDAEALLQTQSQQVGVTIQQQVAANLPIYAEEAANIITLEPGVEGYTGHFGVSGEYPTGTGLFSVDGQTTGNEDWTLDGTDDTSPILDLIVVDPPPDTIQSAKIVTTDMDTDVGKAMTLSVPFETKSGGNQFHGEINDFRTSAANLARNPFLAAQSPGGFPGHVAPALKSVYEGNVGGPILKNRLFFFVDYSGLRNRVGGSSTVTIPTARVFQTCLGMEAANNGIAGCDFSDYSTGLGPSGYIYEPNNGPQYPGNVIPAAQVSTQAINALKALYAVTGNPNTTGSSNGTTLNYSASGAGFINSGQYTERVDFQWTPKMHVFGRYSYFHDNLNGTPIYGVMGGTGPSGIGNPATGHDHNATLGFDDALGDTLLTDLRLGFYRLNELNLKYDEGVNLATNLGIPGLNGTGYALTDGAPTFTVIGAMTMGNNGNAELIEDEYQYQIVNNWTKTLKTHSIKFGVDLRYGQDLRVPSDFNRAGAMTFGVGPTSNPSTLSTNNPNKVAGGLGLATFMLGDVTQMGRYISKVSDAKEMQKRTFFYGMDSWRLTNKLTLNYGLRWEIYFPETINQPGNGGELNLTTGLIAAAGVDGIPSNMGYKTVLGNLAPRVGASYQLDNKTVIRVGYGRAFGMGTYGDIFAISSTQNLPVLANQQLNPATSTSTVFNLSTGPAPFVFPTIPSNGQIPLPAGVTADSRPNPMRYQTLDSWNASVQRAITGTLTVTAGYVGNKGTHVWAGDYEYVNPNPPAAVLPASESITGSPLYWDPSISGTTPNAQGHTGYIFNLLPLYAKFGWTQPINYYCNCADTHFNALRLSVEKRFSRGLNFTANYSWQHANNYDTPYYVINKKVEWGPQDYTRDQVLTVFGFYELPFGRQGDLFKSVPKWADDVIGGWRLSPSVNISGGLPFSVTYLNCGLNLPPATLQQASATGAPCYPNRSGEFPLQLKAFSAATHNRSYFSPYASTPLSSSNSTDGPFSFPAPDQLGNSPRNSFRGPNYWNADLSLEKEFPMWEEVHAQFRMDAYNAFNHMSPGNPSGLCMDCNTSQGFITALAPGSVPRQLVFALKVLF
jgi:hypothetical protein